MSRVGKAIGNALVTAAGSGIGAAVGKGVSNVYDATHQVAHGQTWTKLGNVVEPLTHWVAANPEASHAVANAATMTGVIAGGAAALGSHLLRREQFNK